MVPLAVGHDVKARLTCIEDIGCLDVLNSVPERPEHSDDLLINHRRLPESGVFLTLPTPL